MTHADSTGGPVGEIRKLLPESSKDYAYSLASGAVMFLLAFGIVNNEEAALWTQLVIALVTLIFAVLYSPSTARTTLYAISGPLGAVLMGYGLVEDVRWAVITAAVGQVLGITTAAVASGRPAPAEPSKVATLVSAQHGKTQRA